MRAIWSFWTKPSQSRWLSERYHWLSWGLSLETARQHYPDTWLFTDDDGARLLIDVLELPFAHVSTELNLLKEYDPRWWALGKIWTYREQTEPFLHIDADVFLWKRLPPELESAHVVAQNPEYLGMETSYYHPDELERAIAVANGGWLPEEWQWYRNSGRKQRAECCGVFGGNNTEFIRHYANQSIRLLTHSSNVRAWSLLSNEFDYGVLFEQYLLAACLEYLLCEDKTTFGAVEIKYIFNSMAEAFNIDKATEVGYTHLIAGSKRNTALMERLERRVERDYPEFYARCLKYSLAST